ncbi:thioesterase family protein [Aquitalea sp.]|uniref:thioesterase family protein n=1 Tax=Aquitalea sp. TaxID=1872623 RepID=UPI00258AEABB|nr:thioesterase family protein [Aquitalea sp.]
MARIKIALPDQFIYQTSMDVRIGDINYGGHMANDAILRLAHEARLRWLKSMGYSELDVEGVGIIMADAAVMYRAEAFHGDSLLFKLGVCDSNKYGLDIVYQAIDGNSGKEVARLKTGIVFFDYQTRQVAVMPPAFVTRLNQ